MKNLINNIIGHFRYTPAGKRLYGQMGALQFLPNLGAFRGVTVAETGVICRRFSVRYFAEVNDRLNGITGEAVTRGMSSLFSRDITVEGEVIGATGLMALTLGTTVAFGNSVQYGGTTGTVGRILMDEVTETLVREGWHDIVLRASSNPLLT